LSYLFGNILTATQTELILSFIIFTAVILFVVFFYRDLFTVTFDEELAKSMGVKTNRVNVILMILTAAAVVSAMKIAGIMLVSALLILPPVAALQFSLSFKSTIIASFIFSVISVIGGMLFSFTFNLPTGGTIVIFNAVFLVIVLFAKKMLRTQR
jgi:zinc transport system permease protein